MSVFSRFDTATAIGLIAGKCNWHLLYWKRTFDIIDIANYSMNATFRERPILKHPSICVNYTVWSTEGWNDSIFNSCFPCYRLAKINGVESSIAHSDVYIMSSSAMMTNRLTSRLVWSRWPRHGFTTSSDLTISPTSRKRYPAPNYKLVTANALEFTISIKRYFAFTYQVFEIKIIWAPHIPGRLWTGVRCQWYHTIIWYLIQDLIQLSI